MNLNPAVYDLWILRRTSSGVQYLLLHTSQLKADRHFGGGRFWQIPSGVFETGETVPAAVDRELAPYELTAREVWAAEHAYTIYNRRFHEMQIISVYAVAVDPDVVEVHLDPVEHSDFAWVNYETALARVHYRGLKDGIRSVHEYVTGIADPAPELRLR